MIPHNLPLLIVFWFLVSLITDGAEKGFYKSRKKQASVMEKRTPVCVNVKYELILDFILFC